MDDDDDYVPSAQIRRRMSQYSEARASTSRPVPGSQGRPSGRSAHGSQAGPSSSHTVVSAEARPSTSQGTELSQSEMATLKNLAQKLADSGINLDLLKPATTAAEKKPVVKERIKCVFHPCHSSLSSVSSLLRHYKIVHSVPDPAKFHGCTIDTNVVNLDDSITEHKCFYCGHVARDANALDVHSATSHGTVRNNNLNKSTTNMNASVVADTCKDMFKCDDCSGYFKDKSNLDEHQRIHHGHQAHCKICNKNFLFEEFIGHIRSSHPEVHDKKKEVIVKKIQRTKSGKTRFVFNCTECTESFFDESKAKKHGKAHAVGLKTRVVRSNNNVENTHSNPVDSPPESNILFVCEACNIATSSFDTVVHHSQNHITNPNTKFKSETCDVCKLSFEPACYKQHEVRHYTDKRICKESFTIHTYKYHLLFSDNWTAAFSMAVQEVEKLLAQSIYAHTRSVKMLVLPENGVGSNVFNMYQCGQCNTFVEPASVANHTSNFNTCVKITKKFACTICAREFVSKLARDSHQIAHKGGETIRIVAFNATQDREFNNVLNDPNIMSDILKKHVSQESNAENNTYISNASVIYKCICGLRFVSKEKSENHFRVCLKNDPIHNCPKCDALFNLSELEDHLNQHTIGGSKFVFRDITIEPIVIDSDDESEHDRTPRNNSNENINQIPIKVETSQIVVNSNTSSVPDIIILDSDDEMDLQSNNVEVSTDEQTDKDHGAPLPSTATENEDVSMSESDYQTELEDNHHDCDLNDDDSQGTITYEEPLNANTHDVFNTNEIKCVSTNLLLHPSYSSVYTRRVSEEVRDEIESMRRHIETSGPVTVKQERPWISDPTNFSNISRRPSLRRNNLPVSCTVDLLTDDEDEMGLGIGSVSAQTGNVDINEDSNNDSDTQTISRHTASMTNNENTCNPNPNNSVALAMPDVLINIDNIIRGFNESTTKCKLLNASDFDDENSNVVEVKREINDFDRTEDRSGEHRQSLDWPTSAIRSSSPESPMVLFQNVQNDDRRNWQRNYSLNILVADQNGSIKETNKNCTIC